jgi:peroxiredoxin
MMNRFTVGIFSLAVMFSISAFRLNDGRAKAPNFSLKTGDGKVFELKKLKGKVVVVNFWATWCGPCRAEIPAFKEVYEQYKDKGVEILGVSLDEGGWGDVKPFAARYAINYPILLGNGTIARAYGNIEAIPTTFIIDKSGNIADRHIGVMTKVMLESKLRAVL